MFEGEECSQFTTELDAYMILLVSKLAKSVLRQPHEMPITFCKIEMPCLTLDVFSSTSALCRTNSSNFFVLHASY